MKIFALCKPYLLSQKGTLSAYITIIMASTAIAILSPYIIGDFLDNLIEGADVNTILRFCIIFGGLSLLKIFKGYITALMYVKMQTQMGYNLNMDALRHIQSLSLSYSNKEDSAYLSQRIGSDSNSLIGFCITILQSIIANVITLIVPFVILFTMNRLIAALMLGFIAIYAALYFAFKKPLYNAGFAFREAQAKFFSGLFEQLKYIRLIKLNSIQKEINKRAEGGFFTYKDTAVHSQKVNYLYSSLDGFISTLAQIALFVLGGIQILAGNFTIGMFTVFTGYFNMMLGSSRYFFGIGASYQNNLVSYDRISEIFNRKTESRGEKVINDIRRIELRDLTFSYFANDSKQVIKNFNAEFNKGRIYAITGENGTGKSTLVSLIMGMYIDEYTGYVKYDGTDIRHIDMTTARKHLFGFAEQEPQLINGSIRYNINFIDDESGGLSPLPDEYVRILNMEEFINERTLDFCINENNTNTSGGEKQKISILKVLYKNPAVMIFDEPTSALDAQTTNDFINYLSRIKRDKIIIIITHEDVVKNLCDEVVCFDAYQSAAATMEIA